MNRTIQDKESLLATITTFSHVKKLTKKHLGLDINNQIGVALQEIEISSRLQKNLLVDIKQKQQSVVLEFINKIELLLQNEFKIVAVFDGSKTQKVRQLTTFLFEQMKVKKISKNEALGYLKEGFVIEKIFKKRQYKMQQSKIYWQFYQETIQYIIINLMSLENYGVKIFFPRYQADIQLVKLFQLGFIDFVISNDKDYVNRGVPIISKLELDGKFQLINVTAAELYENRFKQPYKFIKLARENPIKQAMFAALSGSKHLPKLKTIQKKPIPVPLLIQLIESSQNLKEVFNKIRQNYKHFVIPSYYQELAQITMIVELLSPFFNPRSKKIESSNLKFFENIKDRELNIERLEIIWNEYYTNEVRKGYVNINNNQKRVFIHQYFGKST